LVPFYVATLHPPSLKGLGWRAEARRLT